MNTIGKIMNSQNLNIDDILNQPHFQDLPSLNIFQETQLDYLLNELEEKGVVYFDNIYDELYVQQLREECLAQQENFRQAEIQNGRLSEIRSDHILWIDESLPLAQRHLAYLLQLSETLNRSFYLGIHEVEAHFAHYHSGEFYKLHRDNPQNKNGRLISTVYYLHSDWQDGNGGELRVQDKLENWHIIQPKPNRLAIFQSDLLHEVVLSHQDRLSITAWLRQRS